MKNLQNEGAPNEDKKHPKNPSEFSSFAQQGSPQEGFKLELMDQKDNSLRQAKTDRDPPLKPTFLTTFSNTP